MRFADQAAHLLTHVGIIDIATGLVSRYIQAGTDNVFLHLRRREHEYPRLREFSAQDTRCLYAVLHRHYHVHKHDIGMVLPEQFERRLAVTGFGDAPGHTIARGAGRRVQRVEDLPPAYLALARRHHPDVLDDPLAVLARAPA